MTEFEVLGTDQEVDFKDPVGAARSMAIAIAGAAALFVALPIGRQIANWATNTAASALNMNVGDQDPGVSYGSTE